MEVIILAGGFGTRLQSVVKDVPKPMANINGVPFLQYILEYISRYNITKIVLSVGYKQEVIKKYFKNSYKGIPIKYSEEDEPLGTGGAIKKALFEYITTNHVFVLNGDTFFDINLDELKKIHLDYNADITLSLKRMQDFNRYGVVKTENNRVKEFQEKKFYTSGKINCGVYLINKESFVKIDTIEKFSFEEFLENNLNKIKVCEYTSNNSYFIDIGIPVDYEKAKIDFKDLF